MKKSDFVKQSAAYGLQFNEFDHLDNKNKKKLIKLIARIAEASYRRGFQHGDVIVHGMADTQMYKYRYRTSLDLSPYSNFPGSTSAIERLFMEHSELRNIGFSLQAPNH